MTDLHCIVNLVLSAAGVYLIVLSVRDSPHIADKFPADMKEFLDKTSIISKALGIVGLSISIVALFGALGTIMKSPNMLLMYIVFLFLLTLLEIGIPIYSFMHSHEIKSDIATTFNTLMAEHIPERNVTSDMLDIIQKKLKCCGANSSADWKKEDLPDSCCNNEPNNTHTKDLPDSCCNNEPNNTHTCKKPDAYKMGCGEAITQWLRSSCQQYFWIVIVALVLQMVLIFCTFTTRTKMLYGGNDLVPADYVYSRR